VNRPSPLKISVIVTTYNWPNALRCVLDALVAQKTTHPFEIIVADDGSGTETAQMIRDLKNQVSIPILHIWHTNEGFRAAAIRNKAILAAEGDYIIFLDGDCIPRLNFITRHVELAEVRTFIVGNRVLLSRAFTLSALAEMLPLHRWSLWRWFIEHLKGHCNRVLPFLTQPFSALRLKTRSRWKGAKGCNLAIWKQDLLNINGWEEDFTGWGYEDSDLVIRLLRSGVQRKNGRFYIPVIHLWHPENDRTQKRRNWVKLKARETDTQINAEKGLSQYAS
jgi:glycosyltransferase involved in cell wall biosynthesis